MAQQRKTNRLRMLHGQAPRVAPIVGGPIGLPDPPEWLPEAAKEEWDRVVEACSTYPTWLQHGDVAILTAYCATWATWLQAAQDVAARGPLVPGRRDGNPVKNPAVQIARDSAVQLRALCRELGFSPDARRRVDVGDLQQDDDADRLLT